MKENSVQMEKIMREINFKIKIEGRKVLKQLELSTAQFDVLQILYFKGDKKLSDISKSLGVTKSTTTGLIKRLEALNLIEKIQSSKDKRIYNVKITTKGKKIIDEVIIRRISLMEKVIEKMGKDETFIEKLIKLKNTLNEVVEGDEL
ncbi:MarR family transcriptional regulator [Oceanotoga sp. DSM 15011]|uniref:MarR family transcriptional regulator n=1 Tax=Oceanotoga teriensis TaxID=515440 RepID=A0AA45C8R2_9BACT|nr:MULTISPECIES: MarR family transcriptional regulator [Oceanotoga]MDN5342090.1 MarR family transcriptional regulator, organic hydroperoxide resistance regulator [Oceanotoga sp.]MDO7975440.1 MarR family transcriptional regulator [Oceanotoga teriensis]PWJ96272.1 MarR family transcriptional regulator [Oceanotoga teriensis]UYP00056.1 MarR family transcriptional regulator [Oceanotoga sp. DSM 15011]